MRNIIHVQADKGNSLILINKKEYINKTLKFIKNTLMEVKKNLINKELNSSSNHHPRSFKTTMTKPSTLAPINTSINIHETK